MDQGSAAGSAATSAFAMGGITTVHFILMALLAVATVLAILWGIKARRRIAAEREAAGLDVRTGAAIEDEATPIDAPLPDSATIDPVSAPLADTAPELDRPAAAPQPDEADDLTQIKGVGPRLAAQLNALAIHRFADIATLTPDAAQTLDAQLGSFSGRLTRDRWIDQARLLAAGDRAGFEAEFGRLG